MKLKKFSQKGFHATALLVVVVVVGLVGLIGYRVFQLSSGSSAKGQQAATSGDQSVQPTLQVPPRFKLFTDKDAGVQFLYPNVYGIFQEPTKECCGMTKANFPEFDDVLVSNQPSENYVPGVAGYLTFGSNKAGNMEIISSSFGPKIKLDGDAWKVVKPNQYNPENYQSGDTYTEMTRVNSRGLNVWTATWTNEGITTYKLHFVTNGKLRTIALPPFDSEQYSTTYNINDQGPYDAMYAQIRDSVSLY